MATLQMQNHRHVCARHTVSRSGVVLPALWTHVRKSAKQVACRAKRGGEPDGDDEAPATPINRLEATIRRKAAQVEAQITELGMEGLEERLKNSVAVPANPPYRLSTLLAEAVPQGRGVMVFEVARPTPSTTSAELAKLAKQYVSMGADALAVRTDSEDT
eukprot:CAMPEP_0202904284 /NCGR_PEP_ID=MMETSP1392-20130828/28654_1 /ASSEMBLY_ACC=CAM_ASM_000868 /TAXON_ID=225041 /ORGANISM="Chlamydomonas chlamydogama, Strain SAG 11-48b" /LENGTH=159 /DNA_ID=CAMNT_0049591837 /DNA_START=129 /DNA_END=604 /DNA_ORIENTATION=-